MATNGKSQSLKPAGFFSYTRFDDEHHGGWVAAFRKQLSGEIQAQTGDRFEIFYDRDDIKWGQNWEKRIQQSIEATTYFIALLTPSFLKSTECKKELRKFLSHEKKLNRNDLLLSIHFIDCSALLEKQAKTQVAKGINAHQRADWRDLRFESLQDRVVREALANLVKGMCEGWPL